LTVVITTRWQAVAMSDHTSPRGLVLWRSPWVWPPAAIMLAAVAGQWLGGVGALIVLAVIAGGATIGLTGIGRSSAQLAAPILRIFRK
jgi:hypothetical protein